MQRRKYLSIQPKKEVHVSLHVIGRIQVQMGLSKHSMYQEKSDLSYIVVDVKQNKIEDI